jgi:hypothetical protein
VIPNIFDDDGDVQVYGTGVLGGKGAGLIKIRECRLSRALKLKTRILTTSYYDRYLERGGDFAPEDLETFGAILRDLEGMPISIRSSATNEAGFGEEGAGSVRSGENRSFMLPNNHAQPSRRFAQFKKAVRFVYENFRQKQFQGSREKMAIVVNPIPGIHEETLAGPVYFPLVSGVANSYFPYALKTQDPDEGFARIAFGHGYATVFDEFPVISMATIKNPLPLKMMGPPQRFFYAVDMTRNEDLAGEELETMKQIHVRFASRRVTEGPGWDKDAVTFTPLVEEDRFGFRQGLLNLMEAIRAQASNHFQIEFVFNIVPSGGGTPAGIFHIVQLTRLPELTFEPVHFPDPPGRSFISLKNFQGHGTKAGIRQALVVSPFLYTKDRRRDVRNGIATINQALREKGELYIMIVPGRLGSSNRDWGIQVEYRDIDKAAAIFEYGVDVAGRPEPLKEPEQPATGGIYGSHFLYMIQGGYDEDQKRLKTRIYGTQGTHFLTNLVSQNVIYGFLSPLEDRIDPWFFRPAADGSLVHLLEFPKPVTVYADSTLHRCVVESEDG